MAAAVGSPLVGTRSLSLQMPSRAYNTSPLLATALASLPSASALDVDLHLPSEYVARQLATADHRVWAYRPLLEVADARLVEGDTLQVD